MASENSGRELRFLAGLQCFDAAAKTATFYLMNTSKNMKVWGVNARLEMRLCRRFG
jgi:aminoglycoside/choline kinase family phosphotransferase